jgi:hypothetical protein
MKKNDVVVIAINETARQISGRCFTTFGKAALSSFFIKRDVISPMWV